MLNFLAPFRWLSLFGFVLIPHLLTAQGDDWHLSPTGAPGFFLRSTFAHGYMHGYEEGFHNGDLDLQMGRVYREAKVQDKFKKPCGYRSGFGDRNTFDFGYKKGYMVGYTDAYSGRDFRAFQLVEQGRSEAGEAAGAKADRAFDHAFSIGYEIGQTQGLRDGRSTSAIASLTPASCASTSGIAPDGELCGAFQKGYRLGYSDGYTNQRVDTEVFARK
jgi:hypothetical protein